MPVITGNYVPSGIFRNADAATIFSATLRKVDIKIPRKERIELSDGDFLDLEWYDSKKQGRNLMVLLHGLAGNAERPYMKGMARAFHLKNWNVLGMNFRGCSGELNKYFSSYHAGATNDVAEVITHVLALNKFDKIGLLGFSLGGNMVLKYLGEGRTIPDNVIGGMGVSVPCDLAGSLGAINRMRNFVYSKRFELNLKQHLLKRARKFPDYINKRDIASCSSLRDIDDLYTSKAHGFKDAEDYYKKNSSLQFLDTLKKPSFLISAENDSFLSAACYPYDIAEKSEKLYMEVPVYGGHVGFVTQKSIYYHEKRAVEFFENLL